MREKARDKDDTLTGVKRKKLAREWDDEGVTKPSVQKKRKTDELLPSTTSSSKEHEPRTRDLSLPKKPDVSAVPQRSKIRKEPSPLPAQPMRTKAKKERERSPSTSSLASGRPRTKKEVSPLPPARSSAVSQSRGSSGSSQRHPDHQAERATRSNGTTPKIRRKSPVFTSSEDESDVRRRDSTSGPVSHASHTHTHNHSNSRSNSHSRPRPSLPLPTDHASLRARYSSSYLEYLTSFQQIVTQKCKIESLLKTSTGNGSAGNMTDSDGELMDPEELAKLTADHRALKEELEGIHRMFTT